MTGSGNKNQYAKTERKKTPDSTALFLAAPFPGNAPTSPPRDCGGNQQSSGTFPRPARFHASSAGGGKASLHPYKGDECNQTGDWAQSRAAGKTPGGGVKSCPPEDQSPE